MPMTRLLPSALLFGASAASAAGFQITEQNASGLGSVFAGQAALAEDASAVWFNPAELARLKQRRQGVVAFDHVDAQSPFSDAGSCTPYVGIGVGTMSCPFGSNGNLGHSASGGEGGRTEDSAIVPSVYASWPLSLPGLQAGMGVNAPFGLEINRDPNWIGRFRAIDSQTKTVNLNPSIAYEPVPSVALGVGLDAQRFDAKLTNAVSYRALALASRSPALIAAVPPGSEGVATVKAADWGFGWNAGIDVALLDDHLHLAAAYRSAIRYTLTGHVDFANRPAALAALPQVADGSVHADFKVPDILSFAIAWRPPSLPITVLLDWTRTGWNSVQDLAILRDGSSPSTLTRLPLRFKNSHRTGIGLIWDIDPEWSLRTGFAQETSPVVDAFRTPRLPDSTRRWYGVGGRWSSPGYAGANKRGFAIDLGLALVRPKAASSALANQDTALSAPQGSLIGTYRSRATVIGAQLAVAY